MLKLLNSLLKISLTVLSLKLFSHSESYGTLVKGLVSSYSHLDFISHSKQKQTSFWLAKCNLSDDFVKALGEELFSDRADSTLSGLSFHEFLIKHFS